MPAKKKYKPQFATPDDMRKLRAKYAKSHPAAQASDSTRSFLEGGFDTMRKYLNLPAYTAGKELQGKK